MAPQLDTDYGRYSEFDIHNTTFKTVSGHPIGLSVLIPKSLTAAQSTKSDPRPIILRYHGGGLVGSARLFPQFFSKWLLKLGSRHDAIMVAPDYRLLPEASVGDILEDLEDSWKWVQSDLSKFVQEKTNGKVQTDTNRILAHGESAGGYLSLMLGLSHPDKLRGVIGAFPMADMRSPFFNEDFEKPTFNLPQIPYSLIEEHKKKVRSGQSPAIVAEDPNFERAELMFAMIQRGAFKEFFPADKREYSPIERIEDGARFPKGGTFVFHGREDSVVPVEGSLKLAETVKALDPESKFQLVTRPGDHGFDDTADLDEEWLAEGLKPLVASWLE